jgi:hypothetical protein
VQTVSQSVCARVSIGDDGSRLHGEVVGVGKRPSLLILRGPPKKECSRAFSGGAGTGSPQKMRPLKDN